jgi:hypothetical protein
VYETSVAVYVAIFKHYMLGVLPGFAATAIAEQILLAITLITLIPDIAAAAQAVQTDDSSVCTILIDCLSKLLSKMQATATTAGLWTLHACTRSAQWVC